MRIALIAPPWVPVPPPAYGGTEAVVDRLARGYAAAGHDVLLVTTGDSTCPVPRSWTIARAEGTRIGSAVPELRHVLHAYDLVDDYDIVHDHTVMGPVYAAARHGGPPVVTTNHGPFNEELTDIYRAISGTVPIIAISHDQASRAPAIPVAAVIHHGIDLDAFPVGDGGSYLLFLGRMSPEKGAAQAAAIARRAGMPLRIAAKMREPSERRYFSEQVQPLLGDGIEYVGEVDSEERLRLLQDARALLNPIGWAEPFGLVMIEALACGTPVVAFRRGSAPEIVEHGVTGFLGEDAEELTGYLERLDGIERCACRRAAETRFSTQRMVADHIALFERILAERAAGELGTIDARAELDGLAVNVMSQRSEQPGAPLVKALTPPLERVAVGPRG